MTQKLLPALVNQLLLLLLLILQRTSKDEKQIFFFDILLVQVNHTLDESSTCSSAVPTSKRVSHPQKSLS